MAALFASNASVVLVVEGNAACPLWPTHVGTPPDHGFAILEQEEWEPARAFETRLADVLDRFSTAVESARVVGLVASRFWDAGALDGRRRIATEIGSYLSRAGGGTFLLTHGHQHDPISREAITAFAAELAREWCDSGVTVAVRLEETPRRAETRKQSSPPIAVQSGAAPQA